MTKHINPGMDTTINQSRSHFVEIKNCDDCPFKDYGLRKCEVADRWFSDGEYFEPENSIPSWCPKCTSHAHTPAHPTEAQQRSQTSEQDVKELFRKEIAKWKDEDPLFMAYVHGQEAGRIEGARKARKAREDDWKLLEKACVEYHGAPVVHFSSIVDIFSDIRSTTQHTDQEQQG